ncbi:Gag protein [Phytophthora palmivora]|uniref:Gag protein n=1 Tax=Phytophthora palmivora TaxID=4796 RepID=A0A2P4X4P2_9STRA|nr:Gag protein [Phytophthora palmivora]
MDRGGFPYLTGAQFESVRKMVGIFGGGALRSLAVTTPAEQVERIEAFDTYEQGLIARGKEGENLHFWVREVGLAMDTALISTERLRIAFALSNLGGRAKTWAYTREATTPGCFTTWAQLWKRELHEYIQEMRVLAASLVGNPLPEHIKLTVFMDGLKADPSRTQLFRVHANTMEEAIQIALQEEYSHRQARTPTSVWQGHNASSGATVAQNGDKYADALRESEGRSQVSVRLADAEAAEESAEGVSGVGNIVRREVEETESKVESDICSETPTTQQVEDQCRIFDGMSGRQMEAVPEVSALLNLEELSLKDFLVELKAGEIAELLKPKASPQDLNSSSVRGVDVLEGFTKQRTTRLGFEILKNPEDPVYPLVKEYSDVVSKHPPS